MASLDDGRLILAFVVIALHCLPGYDPHQAVPALVFVGGTACRMAVPFFFVASGLFLRPALHSPAQLVMRPLTRLLPIYLFWLCVYSPTFTIFPPSPEWRFRWSFLWTGGTGFQLWFLPALIVSQIFAGLMLRLAGEAAAVAAALLVAAGGLWAVYGLAPHAHIPSWLPRICSGPILVLAGHAIQQHRLRTGTRMAAALLGLAYLAALAENGLIARTSGRLLYLNEFTAGTCLMGAAAVILALSRDARSAFPAWVHPARLSLMLYCVHVLFLWLFLWQHHALYSWRTRVVMFMFIAVASSITAFLLLRAPWPRRIHP